MSFGVGEGAFYGFRGWTHNKQSGKKPDTEKKKEEQSADRKKQ